MVLDAVPSGIFLLLIEPSFHRDKQEYCEGLVASAGFAESSFRSGRMSFLAEFLEHVMIRNRKASSLSCKHPHFSLK
ncbi:hypothetical protein BOX30_05020 [Leptospirillum ferriphilum]|uniref:Uncharacterized protein n=1 Tax=Leptospirillum ferriphilum TaxID=178606 RepID=A0A1V3ST93_9BACT|nr:hypothetical protein ABH19_06820 [Leptospirillum sp. Group II 'CF-1']OOH71195.1 hypothetical protein BOX24_09120 [Leptospirillum ferriphilum]OOH80901.1 hypothetical protein BOX30_05020 [Leptospirillum ferriphilum]